jgi:F0F1-type ATP synthase membrane subunit c/vacuolar-type H+-ATPase subunit K
MAKMTWAFMLIALAVLGSYSVGLELGKIGAAGAKLVCPQSDVQFLYMAAMPCLFCLAALGLVLAVEGGKDMERERQKEIPKLQKADHD